MHTVEDLRNQTGRAPVLVVGAGSSGLATAAMLGKAGLPAVVLDGADRVGSSWSERYDHLELHTTRRFSALPGLPVPRQAGCWVGRDDWVRYLRDYADHHRLDIRTATVVRRIEPAPPAVSGRGALWQVSTAGGPRLAASAVIVATGRNRVPRMPDWPGRTSFTGALLHAAQYRHPGPYRGRAVLVVGAGNSAAEIAVALSNAGAGPVWMAVRTPPHIVPRSSNHLQAFAGVTQHMPRAWGDCATAVMQRLTLPDLTPFGLPRPTVGMYTRAAREEVNPVLDHGLVDAIRSGGVRVTAAVTGFDGPRVLLADDTSLTPEVVIAATGYRTNLPELLGPSPVLDAAGLPLVRGERTHSSAPHLYFAGFGNPLTGALHHQGVEARRIARTLSRTARALSRTAPSGRDAATGDGVMIPRQASRTRSIFARNR
ncbi:MULTISPECIES: flavin-containing monooxygenase [unclassified Streptomyces]|uniref:flavin-containing monooxygenase n=1 Tax=unclassified Streptomyces TaxID=2593676 RepID=UPI002E2F9E1B|nr:MULTISPECIES: NAD(P)/FAD-dependent oxidoreductase [unclassified Streptomyces]WUC68168.1 NAD(P)/FAD-dependent oxidoreductase [Streptomyces sp. NBC_00539]